MQDKINLAAVLDEIPIGVCLVSKERRIVLINRSLEAMTGFFRADCKGLPCSHVLRFNHCFGNCPVERMEGRQKCVLEGDIINQDNQKLPVNVTFAPLRDGSGVIAGYIETLDDLRQVRNFDLERINPFSPSSPGPVALSADEGYDWSAMERKMIMDALLKVKGRRSKAAQLLGWGRSTLWRKMKRYGIACE